MAFHEPSILNTGAPKPRRRPLIYDPRSEIVRELHLPLVIGISLPTAWRLQRAGQFVPRIQLSKNSVGFRRADLEAWLTSRQLVAQVDGSR
jgi:predicted DNA-binding transcriptional regulator AlpA